MQQGLGQARALGGWGGQEGGEGRAPLVLDRAHSSELAGAPTAEGQGWREWGGRPGSSRLGGGLGDHAADAQRLRVETGGPGQPGTEEARVAMGCGSLGASSHELCSHTVQGLKGWAPGSLASPHLLPAGHTYL